MNRRYISDPLSVIYLPDDSHNQLVDSINSSEDLLVKWYDKGATKKRLRKLSPAMMDDDGKYTVDFNGKTGLELGFGVGESCYCLSLAFPTMVLDGVDFNPMNEKLIPFFHDLFGGIMGDFWIGNTCSIPKPDVSYDFINSSSFFEHLTEGDYWPTIRECHRVLKPGGQMFVFVDQQPDEEQHIRVISPEDTRKELVSVGFTSINPYRYEK